MDQHIFFEKWIWVHLCSPTLKSEPAILVFKADWTNLPASCHLAEIPNQLTERKIAFSACYIYLKTKREGHRLDWFESMQDDKNILSVLHLFKN
jgi:hypothetical protein